MSTQEQLQQAYNLIKAKDRQGAVDILLPILHADENNANAWWLLANALTAPDDVREALEKVLELRPSNDQAAKMLERLNAQYPPKPKPVSDGYEDFGFDDDMASDPFGGSDPFAAAPQRASRPAASADPFGDMTAAPRSSGGSRPARASSGDDDPFGVLDRKPIEGRKASSSKGGTNPLVIVLAVVGVIAVLGCIACAVVPSILATVGAGMVNQVLEDIDFENLEGFTSFDMVDKGSITYGDVRQDRLDAGQQHRYVFSGQAGDTVVISMTATNAVDDLDTYLTLYNSSGGELTSNDDIDFGTNYNSRIDGYVLPASGTYIIGARAFGLDDGAYELRLSRR